MSFLTKNTAGQKWRVFAFNRTTNAPVTGDALNITANISLDWGTPAGVIDTNPTEVEDGFYDFTLTQAETNGSYEAGIFPESVTSNVVVIGVPAVKAILAIATETEVAAAVRVELAVELAKILDAAGVRTALGMATANLDEQLVRGITTGAVADEAATTTSFTTDLTEATNDHYKGNVLVFTAGALATQARRILAYNGTTKMITLESALTDAPANGAAFMIVGRIEE